MRLARSRPEAAMKVLLPIDGSAHSHAAVAEVAGRPWAPGTEFEVLTVVHSHVPLVVDPLFLTSALHVERTEELLAAAPALVEGAAEQLRRARPGASVSTKVAEGTPADEILDEARRWGANLIVLGSHGRGPIARALLGSVASRVAAAAPCGVEIVRPGRHGVTARGAA
jgi:nucleotide-binding universal stress UspA family protein